MTEKGAVGAWIFGGIQIAAMLIVFVIGLVCMTSGNAKYHMVEHRHCDGTVTVYNARDLTEESHRVFFTDDEGTRVVLYGDITVRSKK